MIGLGCMRLSTEPDRDDANGIAVLHAAFDAGITLLDTADAYCLDDSERGHNERLIAAAIARWNGDRSTIRVATKGGLTRPGGRWEPDGRAKALAAACRGSCHALGVERIQLYQLHAPDPRVPLSTSVRALAALKRQGLIERIGLCNVNVTQIEEARKIVDIDSVQVELSLWHDEHLYSGVVQYCTENGLQLLAYRPLGGTARRRKTSNDPALKDIAERHGATPQEIALAWLLALRVIPLPGATRMETIASIARAREVQLSDEDLERLGTTPRAPREAVARGGAEVVIVMGLPGAGKSTYAVELVERGYVRLNRDLAGGTLRDLLPAMDAALARGETGIVLDNTYVTRESRAEVIHAAAKRGVPVRCIWLTTSLEDAQVNAAWRTSASPREVLLPAAQFRAQRMFEPPDIAEGFSRVDAVRFERRLDASFVNRAVILSLDGVLLRSREGHRSPVDSDDVEVVEEHLTTLRRYAEDGYRLLGISWQPGIAEGTQTTERVAAIFARMNELARSRGGASIEVGFCPHAAGPPRCWCRKPLPGLGVDFIQRHKLDPVRCIYVGAGPQDPGFARRLGFEYRDAAAFF